MFIKVNGKMEKNQAEVNNYGVMVLSTKVIGKMGWLKVLGDSYRLMVTFTKVNGI